MGRCNILNSHYREEDVENEAKDLLHGGAEGADVGSLAEGGVAGIDSAAV
jgi:hypothetical protein